MIYGGGGGGGGNRFTSGAIGRYGTVIMRIPTANYSGVKTGTSTTTTDGSYTLVKWFKGSGTYTV